CLLKPPTMIMSGLPPAFQIDCSTLLRFASVKARCVPSVRVPVPSAAAGSEPPAPFDVLLLIQDSTEAGLRAVVSLPVTWRWWVRAGFASFARLGSEALGHLLVGGRSVAAGWPPRPLGAGDAGHLVGDLADIAEPHRRRGGGGGGVVAFELGVGGVGGGER